MAYKTSHQSISEIESHRKCLKIKIDGLTKDGWRPIEKTKDYFELPEDLTATEFTTFNVPEKTPSFPIFKDIVEEELVSELVLSFDPDAFVFSKGGYVYKSDFDEKKFKRCVSVFLRLSDHAHRQMAIVENKTWPFRHGSNNHPGVEAHLFELYFAFIVENVKVLFMEANNCERPHHGKFLYCLATQLIEESLK